MKFYIASSFQNKVLVRLVANKLKEIDWKQTYDWTQYERVVHKVKL
ncbi:hypothetical protein ACE41A_02840 [Bacillus cytotoxicus]